MASSIDKPFLVLDQLTAIGTKNDLANTKQILVGIFIIGTQRYVSWICDRRVYVNLRYRVSCRSHDEWYCEVKCSFMPTRLRK